MEGQEHLASSKVKLMRTLILSTFLYACESWTLTAEIERRIQAFEMRCYRSLLNISYKVQVTNEEVRNRIQIATGVHDDLLTMVKKRKLRWYGHISRSSGMAKTILQGTVKGTRRRGRQKKRWEDNIKEWTGMGFRDSLRAAEARDGWKGIVATSSVAPRRPPRLRDWDEMRWDEMVKALSNSKFTKKKKKKKKTNKKNNKKQKKQTNKKKKKKKKKNCPLHISWYLHDQYKGLPNVIHHWSGHCRGAGRGSSIESMSAWHASGPEFDPHILSWTLGHEKNSTAILPLPLIQEEQLSVNGERMCNKYW